VQALSKEAEPPAVTVTPVAEPEAAVPAEPEHMPAPKVDATANATPLSRRLADLNGIDLTRIAGSGPNGKIVRRDLGLNTAVALLAQPTALVPVLPVASAPVVTPPPPGVPVTTTKLSTMRRTIARRLSESKQTVPHFYLTARCNLDALLRLRSELNADLASRGVKLSVNDLLIKALAIALMREPNANVQYGGDYIHHFSGPTFRWLLPLRAA
jgi:pyruvate dehydrogenase E2 component (dihydrolipoamide acetyltransferase)